MNKILLRADDLGYSQGVNYGIYDSVRSGMVKNVGVMINMPFTEYGLSLLKDFDIDIGQHTNISNGRPISDPAEVPSLVDKHGFFKASKVYRQNYAEHQPDFVNLDEVVKEIDAQYQQFLKLVGHKPDYFEGHAVMSENFLKGLQIVAEKYDLPFLGFPTSKSMSFKQQTKFLPLMGGYKNGKIDEDYNALDLLKEAIKQSRENNEIPMIISHPGYLDDDILTYSSLTIPRTKEAAAWISDESKQLIEKTNTRLVKYSECE